MTRGEGGLGGLWAPGDVSCNDRLEGYRGEAGHYKIANSKSGGPRKRGEKTPWLITGGARLGGRKGERGARNNTVGAYC